FQETQAPMWERYADKGKVRFELNMSHPLLLSLKEGLSDEQYAFLKSYLGAVSASLPVEMIYSDYSSSPRSVDQFSIDENTVVQKLDLLKKSLFASGEINADIFREVISSMRMFDAHEELVERYLEGGA